MAICIENVSFKSFSKSGRAFAAKVGATKKVQDMRRTELDDYLNSLGGRSTFMMGIPEVRKVEFDGAWGNIWYEAKMMDYFDKAAASAKKLSKFKKMRDAKKIAESDVHRATFVVITNVSIHPKFRAKLDELGIKYVEML